MRTHFSLAILAVCFGVLLAPVPALAQDVHGGVKGGVAFSNIANLNDAIEFGGPVDIERRIGIVIGPFVSVPMNDMAAIQVEALFATRGASPTDGADKFEIQLGYVDVPVLLRLEPSRARPLYLLVGPSVNFNARARTLDVPSKVEQDVKDEIRNIEFGLVVAAGLNVRHFLLEGRYSTGLSDIGDSPRVTATIRNRSFAILAGVSF